MRPWFVNIEQETNRKLLSEPYFTEFLIDGLLRGDMMSRYQAYAIARQNGWFSANDIRELENQNPLPGESGNIYLVPMNMVDASTLGQPSGLYPQRHLYSTLTRRIASKWRLKSALNSAKRPI